MLFGGIEHFTLDIGHLVLGGVVSALVAHAFWHAGIRSERGRHDKAGATPSAEPIKINWKVNDGWASSGPLPTDGGDGRNLPKDALVPPPSPAAHAFSMRELSERIEAADKAAKLLGDMLMTGRKAEGEERAAEKRRVDAALSTLYARLDTLEQADADTRLTELAKRIGQNADNLTQSTGRATMRLLALEKQVKALAEHERVSPDDAAEAIRIVRERADEAKARADSAHSHAQNAQGRIGNLSSERAHAEERIIERLVALEGQGNRLDEHGRRLFAIEQKAAGDAARGTGAHERLDALADGGDIGRWRRRDKEARAEAAAAEGDGVE